MIVDLNFHEWEKKLPWVKKYLELLNKPLLTKEDCYELPNNRAAYLASHQDMIKAHPQERQDEDPNLLYNQAIENLVNKFCEPIETQYKDIIDQLKGQEPKRDDFLVLSSQLKSDYLAAADLRLQCATNMLFNHQVKVSRFSRTISNTKSASADFDNQIQVFKTRYINLLKVETRVLQNKFNTMQLELEELENRYQANELIKNKMESTNQQLTTDIRSKLDELNSIIGSANSETSSSTSTAQILPPPPPPPPPASKATRPILVKPSPTTLTQGSSEPTNKPFVLSADTLDKIILKKVSKDSNSGSPQLSYSKLTQGNITLVPVKPVLTPEQMEQHLHNFSQRILRRQSLLDILYKRNKLQQSIISTATEQQKKLQQILDQIDQEIKAKKQKENSSLTQDALPIAPPLLPPAPPKLKKPMILDKKTTKSEQQEEKSIAEQTTKDQKTFDRNELLLKISARRQKFVETSDDSSTESEKVKPGAAVFKTPAQEPKEPSDAGVLAKYSGNESADQNGTVVDPKTQAMITRVTKQVKNLDAQIAKTDVHLFIEKTTVKLQTVLKAPAEKIEILPESAVKPSTSEIPPAVLSADGSQNTGPVNEQEISASSQVEPLLQDSSKNPTIDLPAEDNAKPALSEAIETAAPKVDIPETLVAVEKIGSPQVVTSLEQLKKLTENSQIRKVIEQYPLLLKKMDAIKTTVSLDNNPGVLKDLHVIHNFVEQKQTELASKKLSHSASRDYSISLANFYIDALSIRLDNKDAQTQVDELKAAAKTHFKPRHNTRRLCADALIMVCGLFVSSLVVGAVRVSCGHTFFFSQEKSKRETDFNKMCLELSV